MITGKSKAHKPHSYTKSQLKEMDALPSYQEISSRVSTEVNNNFQSDEKTSQKFLEMMETARRGRFWKGNNKINIKNENEIIIPCVPEQEHHKKTISLLRNFYDNRKKQGA